MIVLFPSKTIYGDTEDFVASVLQYAVRPTRLVIPPPYADPGMVITGITYSDGESERWGPWFPVGGYAPCELFIPTSHAALDLSFDMPVLARGTELRVYFKNNNSASRIASCSFEVRLFDEAPD